MTKRERVLAALHNHETDYVPGCFWRHYSPEIDRGEDVVEAHMKFYRETDVDFIKISSDGYFGWPEETLKNLKDVSELYNIKHIPMESPYMTEQVERAQKIVEAANGECCTFYTLFCPLSVFRLQVGWDKMMECIRKDPKAVMYAYNIIAEDVMALIKALITEAGVDGIFYSVQNAEMTRFTLEEYNAWVRPGDLKVLDYMNSLSDCNIIHCCGWDADAEGTTNRMESWSGYQAACISWAAYVDNLDANEIRKLFPGSSAWGGFDNRKGGILYHGTEEEIKEETRRLIRECGKKGYMLGPDCSLPTDIDVKHIKWVMETTKSMDNSKL